MTFDNNIRIKQRRIKQQKHFQLNMFKRYEQRALQTTFATVNSKEEKTLSYNTDKETRTTTIICLTLTYFYGHFYNYINNNNPQ